MDECGIYGVIRAEDTLTGAVSSGGEIQGKLDTASTLVGSVGFPKCDYPMPYIGEYEVTPRSYEQYLDTNDKYMSDDVTVKQIPYFETSNDYGETIYIGTL